MRMPLRAPAAAVTAALILSSVAVAGVSAAPSGRATLAGSVPSWANAASLVAKAPGSNYLGFRVYLNWHNQGTLNTLLAAQQNPRSAQFRHWLTPAQFLAQFGPTQSEVDSVSGWLSSTGLTVDYVPSNRHYVEAEGPISKIEAAFAVSENVYSVQGRQLEAPATTATVPANLAASIAGVIGLDQSAYLVRSDIADAPGPAPFNTPGPCSTYYGEEDSVTNVPSDGAGVIALPANYQRAANGGIPWVTCGYGPGQVQDAYGLNQAYAKGVDGTGVTVAVVDAYGSPTALQALTQFSANHNLPTPDLVQVVAPGTFRHPESGYSPHFGGPIQDPQGWYEEESLDLDSVHTTAPGATIVYVGAPNNFQDLDAAVNHVVSTRLADIVTNSWGFPTEALPPGYIKPFEQTLQQGAAEGISILFSSGDNGDESTTMGYVTADYPASSPNVISVGGTSLLVGAPTDSATDPGNASQSTTATPTTGAYGSAPFNEGRGETGWGTGFSAWNWTGDPYADCSTGAETWCPTVPGVFFGGAGGGVSQLFDRPAWQTGVTGLPPGTARVLPDVSMNADPNTGDLFGLTYTVKGKPTYLELRIGGTSLASPLFAGALALAVQRAGTSLGQADSIFYQNAGAFHDVVSSHDTNGDPTQAALRTVATSKGTVTSLRTLDEDTSLQTTVGWDEVTGLGSVNGWNWVTAIAGK